jgi:predicted Zn-dependent protease
MPENVSEPCPRIDMLSDSHEEAIAHFRAAVALKPDWQVGALALSHALHRHGSRDESREVLEHGLNVSWTNENLFGWWSYETGLSGRFGPLLESMRSEVLAR